MGAPTTVGRKTSLDALNRITVLLGAIGVNVRQLTYEMERLRHEVTTQAEDPGLWFRAQTAPEAYLQHALRRLHALIEGDEAAFAALEAEGPP